MQGSAPFFRDSSAAPRRHSGRRPLNPRVSEFFVFTEYGNGDVGFKVESPSSGCPDGYCCDQATRDSNLPTLH